MNWHYHHDVHLDRYVILSPGNIHEFTAPDEDGAKWLCKRLNPQRKPNMSIVTASLALLFMLFLNFAWRVFS